MRNVLFATDGSEHSLKAASWLGEVLRNTREVRVTLLHVLHPHPRGTDAPPAPGGSPDVDLAIMEQTTARPILQRTRQALGRVNGQVTEDVRVGHPAEEICRAAQEGGHDVLVLGSRGMSQWKGMLMGSVSDRVAHMAPCPVLIVR